MEKQIWAKIVWLLIMTVILQRNVERNEVNQESGLFQKREVLKGTYDFKKAVQSTRLTAVTAGKGWKVSIDLCNLENYL